MQLILSISIGGYIIGFNVVHQGLWGQLRIAFMYDGDECGFLVWCFLPRISRFSSRYMGKY